MSEQKKGLTFQTSCANNDLRTSSNGLGMGTSDGTLPPSAQAEKSGPPAKPHSSPVSSDAIPLIDRIGQTLRTLKEAEWRCLHERGGLIEPMFTKRQKLVCVRLQNGIALATINAALRVGMRDRLPIAADSRTIEIEPGMRTTFRFVRIKAWSPEER
jgi:hypothetical protein